MSLIVPRNITTVKEASDLYDYLYAEGIRIIFKYNPCKIVENRCREDLEWCCKGCKHLTKKGCGVAALYCKLHLCWNCIRSSKESQICWEELKPLRRIAEKFGLGICRKSKKETLKIWKDNYKFFSER